MNGNYETYIFQKPDREIDRVFIHCSASSNPEHDNVSVIRRWHIQDRGWSDIGYHYYINRHGTLEEGRSLNKTPAAQKGHNTGTIAICLGGLVEEDFTVDQFDTLVQLCTQIKDEIPDVTFHGHCEVAAKDCPVFDYQEILGLDDYGSFIEVDTLTVEDRLVELEERIRKLERSVLIP